MLTQVLGIIELVGIAFGLPLAIALFASGKWRTMHAWQLSALSLFILAVYMCAIYCIPTPKLLAGLQWNWTGKIVAIAVMAAAYAYLPRSIKTEVGLFARPKPPEWRSVLGVSLFTVLFFAGCHALVSFAFALPCIKPSAETLAFQATLPGLDEELAFRGILLAVLVAAFGEPWKIAGIALGWGALPIILFFGFAHGFDIAASHPPPIFIAVTMVITAVMGALLLWIKERTGSIWIAVIVHNLANVIAHLICS
jgi:membrane protease YdiL (CAAX protease family)